jgi:hypothetical protein
MAGVEARDFGSPEPRTPDKTTVVHDDGTEQEIGPGQTYVIESGHDAWVVGSEPVVGFEFQSRTAEEFARG